jgi:hypothetical protein
LYFFLAFERQFSDLPFSRSFEHKIETLNAYVEKRKKRRRRRRRRKKKGKLATRYLNAMLRTALNRGNFPKALTLFQRAVDIGQHSLHSNDPQLQIYIENLEAVKRDKNYF